MKKYVLIAIVAVSLSSSVVAISGESTIEFHIDPVYYDRVKLWKKLLKTDVFMSKQPKMTVYASGATEIEDGFCMISFHPPYGEFQKVSIDDKCRYRVAEIIKSQLTLSTDMTAPNKKSKKKLESRLRKLKQLRARGLITEDEYIQKKKQMLNEL